MAMKQLNLGQKKLTDTVKCPQCSGRLLTIDGSFVKWLTCPECKYKKLIGKDDFGKVKITPLLEKA